MKNRLISFFLMMASAINAQTAVSQTAGQQMDSIKVAIKNVGPQINSSSIDYAPLISADGDIMVFTSRKSQSENKVRNLKDNIYYSNFDTDSKKWSDAKSFSESVNMSGRNNSAVSLLNNGQQMLIYRDDLNTNGDIYESHLSGAEWTEPVNLGEPINSEDKEPSACISPDGETIYFVSDRKGGLGGFDIWYSIKNTEGKWAEAINIGAPINSSEDEDGLFIHSDGKTLFFSSKGHNSMGGFDVFMSVLDVTTKVGSSPKNIGPSINTPEDDIYFVMEASGKIAYYSSNRTGGLGEKDIYRIDLFEDIMKTNLHLLKGRILDKKGNPLKSTITVKDKKTGEVVGTYTSNAATGKYLTTLPAEKSYDIEITSKGYSNYEYSIEGSSKLGYNEVDKDIVLKLKKSKDIKGASADKTTKQTLKNSSPSVSGKVLDEDGNPLKVQIEIIDNNTNKVVGRYYNSIKDGTFDLKLKGDNFRVEFTKSSYLFKSVNVVLLKSEAYTKNLGDIRMELVGIGKKIILNKILFDYTKSTLREESYLTLDRTIRLMGSLESLEVEISGHTDNSGSANHNQALSEDRARQVMKYIIRMGVDEERLKYKGYGFIQPVASNDSEAGRQLNRRTELIVINVDIAGEQLKEITLLKKCIVAEAKANSKVTNLSVVQENNGSSSVPDRFKQFDTEQNGKISFEEIIAVIDSFLSQSAQLDAKEVIAIIDYYFEQPLF